MKQLDELSTYLNHRIDIICNDPIKWLKDLEFLPTFEYHKANCIDDKGGKYDYTVRRYTKERNIYRPSEECNFTPIKHELKTVSSIVKHSYWMGTPFNFEMKTTIA